MKTDMEPVTSAGICQALAEIVGSRACLSSPCDIEPYVLDYRKMYRGSAAAVVLPATTEEVSRVAAWCHAHDIAIVPQGGNTSLMGGSVPGTDRQAVVVSLKRMNRVLHVDPMNDTLTVEAGVTLHAARAAAERSDRLFPLRIGSEGTCQIGGNIATNAGGTAVLRYGNMRDLVLGVEAVLPDGRVFDGLRGLRKDNTGYDLKQLFVGSEGTLGIVTAAVLKLAPRPSSRAVAFVAVSSPAAAVELLVHAKEQAGHAVTAFELISQPALRLVREYLGGVASPLQGEPEWMVLVELTSSGSAQSLDELLHLVLEQGVDRGCVLDAAVATSLSDVEAFWQLREEISDAQTRTGGSIKCDISVPLSAIARFVEEASVEVLRLAPSARMVIYGHMGDGNVHFNPLRPVDVTARDFLDAYHGPVSSLVDGIAHRMGGSISAEHGIGVAKRKDLAEYKSPVELSLMRQVKQALDPKGLLNPGKVLE
jgi:FAD/FMN-containing dehydrogenase